MEISLLYDLLKPFSDIEDGESAQKMDDISKNPLSKVDFFVDGLTGAEKSAQKRDELAKKFGLPPKMTPNALLEALKVISTYEEYLVAVSRKPSDTK